MKINKEGFTILFLVFIVSAIISVILFLFSHRIVAWVVTGVLAVNWVLTALFFREPHRERKEDADLIYAPADGRIVVVEKVQETEYLNEKRLQISVFMSLANVHVNWFPAGGEIEYFKYHPGEFMVAWHPKSSEKNERTTTVVNLDGQTRVLFRQIAGYVARRIISYAEVGKVVRQNDKCGFIKFGSRVDVLLPEGAEPLVSIDDRVVGSQTPIARLKR